MHQRNRTDIKLSQHKKEEEGFTNYETFPYNEFESSKNLEQFSPLLERYSSLSIQNNVIEDWIEDLISENHLQKEAFDKAKAIIEALQKELQFTRKDLVVKENELQQAKTRIQSLQQQLGGHFPRSRKVKTRIIGKNYEKPPILENEETEKKNLVPQRLQIDLLKETLDFYDRAFADLNQTLEGEKGEFLYEKYSSQIQIYQSEVQHDLNHHSSMGKTNFKEGSVVKLICQYQKVIKFYKHHCNQLKTSLNECLSAFQEYIAAINLLNSNKTKSEIVPKYLFTIAVGEIKGYVLKRQSQLEEDNLEMQTILEALMEKIRK